MKKFLSLVLALVMAMSLVTVSAGAKDFTDDDSITYDEAVAVISEIGVVDGYKAGDFKPTEVLTRGAAAKIICNLILGPTTASALSASSAPFKDVPVSNVFAGYITYCSQLGIINGYSDGTFRPTGTLTGNAFMKMLLGALGYDSEIEGYTGANWNVAVMKQAVGLGLDDGNDEFVGTKAVTREEAALYAFNMLQATVVEYEAKTTVNVNGATVTVAGNKPQDKNWGTATNNDGTIADDGFVQFAEEYFPDLVLSDNNHDDFYRPANVWYFKGVKVGTFAKTADATYTKDVSLGTIYADLGMADKDDAAPVYVDGVKAVEYAKVSKGNDLEVGDLQFNAAGDDCYVGNGTKIEAFLNTKTNDVTIVAINTFVAEVNKVVAATSSKEAYITLTELTAEDPAPVIGGSGLQANDEYETTAFANDDIVLFTYANDKIQSVVAAESVEGTLTKRIQDKSIDLGETTYKYSNAYSVDGTENNLSINSEYIAYLDEAGYAIYVEESEYNIQDYAFLRGLQTGSVIFNSNKASLLGYDGKTTTVNTTENYVNSATNPTSFVNYAHNTEMAIGAADAKIVLAREATSGDYRLKALTTRNVLDNTDATYNFAMQNGVASIQTGDTTGTTVYADSKTVVVVGTHVTGGTATYRAYTGAKNMPTISHIAGQPTDLGVSYYCRNNGVVTIMFIDVDTTHYNVVGGNNDVIFFSVESGSKWTENADNSYYSYTAVVNGEIIEDVMVADDVVIKNTAGVVVAGSGDGKFDYTSPNLVFTNADYDDGIITSLTVKTGAGYVQGVNKLSNENLVLGWTGVAGSGSTFVVSNDVKVFFMDDDGVVTQGSISNVRRSTDDIVTYVLKDGQISYLFVQQYFEDNDQSSTVTDNVLTSLVYNSYVSPNLNLTLNGTNAGQTYTVTLKMIVAGVTTELGTYKVTGTAGASSTTVNLSVGSLANISASSGIYMVSCGGQNATFTA